MVPRIYNRTERENMSSWYKKVLFALLSIFVVMGLAVGTANADDTSDSTDVGTIDLGDDSPAFVAPDVPQSAIAPTDSSGETIIEDDTSDPNAEVQDANGIWVPWHSCKGSPTIPALSVYPADHVIASAYISCNRSTATDTYVQLQYTDANGYWRVFGTAHVHHDSTAKYWVYKSASCAYPSRSRWWRTKEWTNYQQIQGIDYTDGPRYSVARWISHCR